MPSHVAQTPMLHSTALVSAHQFDLALDHPRVKGLTPSERRAVITLLARVMLEARGIANTATQEDGDEHA
jgi:hypothetical protein